MATDSDSNKHVGSSLESLFDEKGDRSDFEVTTEMKMGVDEAHAPLGKARWDRVALMVASPEAAAAIEAWKAFRASWAAFEAAHPSPEGLFWHVTAADSIWVELVPAGSGPDEEARQGFGDGVPKFGLHAVEAGVSGAAEAPEPRRRKAKK